MKTVAFVPMKLNNERVPGKNTKKFSNGIPLYRYILNALLNSDGIDEVYVFCSDIEFSKEMPAGVKYLLRSSELDQNSTKINEVMLSFANEIKADNYVLAHATAPFISSETIKKAVDKVVYEGCDSSMTVHKLQEFIWKDGQPVNYNPSEIPRTQDLPPYYIETTGLYVYKRDLIVNHNRRIGDNPGLIEVSSIESVDINNPIDFDIANIISSKVTAPSI